MSGIQTLSLLNAQPEKPVLVLQFMELAAKLFPFKAIVFPPFFLRDVVMSSLYQHSCKVATVKGWAMYRQIPSSVKKTDSWLLAVNTWLRNCQGSGPGRLGDCSDINKA